MLLLPLDGKRWRKANYQWAQTGFRQIKCANKPRFWCRAIACGIPVIASEACGLGAMAGLTTIAVGDVAALRSPIANYTHLSMA